MNDKNKLYEEEESDWRPRTGSPKWLRLVGIYSCIFWIIVAIIIILLLSR